MSAKAIREADGKRMLASWLQQTTGRVVDWDLLQVTPSTVLSTVAQKNSWLTSHKLVVKPDQLIKRRGKSGLIKLNASWDEAAKWIEEKNGKEVKVETVSGVLDHFLVERFWPHAAEDEYYVCIQATRAGDEILFFHQGGVDVGDVDAKASRFTILVGDELTPDTVNNLVQKVPASRRAALTSFIVNLYKFFVQLHYTYLEINPIIMIGDELVIPLDMAAKIDETAKFVAGTLWGGIEFPPPFGRPLLPEEARIAEMDSKTGASLKLTVLNPKGRVWTMVAGGGASVIYADTISDLGFSEELANYGEYSGAPDEEMTFQYARTILELMTKEKDSRGKVLIIGGGIANFTNVAETFKGIIRALTKFSAIIIEHHIRIFVRRGGPNYMEGLEMMRGVARSQELDIQVFGPETHMTAIVSMALGKEVKTNTARLVPQSSGPGKSLMDHVKGSSSQRASVKADGPALSSSPKPTTVNRVESTPAVVEEKSDETLSSSSPPVHPSYELFTPNTRALIYGLQPTAAQTMLDFDFICGRKTRSVAALVYPFTGNHYQKFYWATGEVLLPIYQDLGEAINKNSDVDVVVNFASMRSVYESTIDIMKHPGIKTIAIIAEGVPERQTRLLLRMAKAKGVTIIGPATVGGIKAGAFRIGNTGGALDNIIAAKLYRPGSVAYVARSGGMSNELNNIIAQNSDGVYEGIAIGGDRYPGTTFIDHLLRYQDNPQVKLMVVLGEVGGIEEYEICKLIKNGRLTKPIVAWCIGTCAKMFPYEVQFGHAGACASGQVETADAKNAALKAHGVHVPQSFDDFGVAINEVYCQLVEAGKIIVKEEMAAPTVPVDYDWARKLGLIRKPAGFVSSIVDERGDELEYAGMKISEVLKSSMGIGGVVGLIWFRKRLPDYFCRFIELVLMVTADHGPAVAGAHNTIVAARAGKDLISSLCSGLLTIGPRFGGALDGAAQKFSWGYDTRLSGEEFVNTMRRNKELIMGIGHKIKSLENPDARVVIVKEFAHKYFRSTEILDYACSVELITSRKKSNLILNVDGAIGCAFVDLLRSCGAFTLEEANEYVEVGALNGLFVLGRSIGFIGHYIDQNRLKQPLYRHPQEDISYLTKEQL